MNKQEKQNWKKKARELFNITEEMCLEERPDFLEKTKYQQRCIQDEILGRKLLEYFKYYETTFNAKPAYINDLNMQLKGVDLAISLGNRSILIDEKACYGGTTYNDSITLEILQLTKYGHWQVTQKGKITNELLFLNVCLDTQKAYVVRMNYSKMLILANKYASIMPEAVKELLPGTTDGVYHKTLSGEGIYVLVPFSEAESVVTYNLKELNI